MPETSDSPKLSYTDRQYQIKDAEKRLTKRIAWRACLGLVTFAPLLLLVGNIYRLFGPVHVSGGTPFACAVVGYCLAAYVAYAHLWRTKYGLMFHNLHRKPRKFKPQPVWEVVTLTVLAFWLAAFIIPPITGAIG